MEEVSIGEFARRSRLSIKALRRYDELGVLVPARVDEASGYRYYDVAQLEAARLVAMLRQLDLPLAAIRELLACDPVDAAERIAAHWREVESAHDARRELADYLVNRLSGKRSVMYEVATREIPERSLLCLKRNVDEQGTWALGKESIAILRERPLPKIEGREGAMFCIWWGVVNADGDGPIERCAPIPGEARSACVALSSFTLRTESAHREAFVALPNDMLPTGPGGIPGVRWQLASEALHAWWEEHGINPDELTLKPKDLGVRMTYFATRAGHGDERPLLRFRRAVRLITADAGFERACRGGCASIPGDAPQAPRRAAERLGAHPSGRVVRATQLRDVQLAHAQHRLHRGLGLRGVRVADELHEDAGHDLPGEAVPVLQPATWPLLTTCGQRGPQVVHLVLRLTVDPERDSFGELVPRPAVERGEHLPSNRKDTVMTEPGARVRPRHTS